MTEERRKYLIEKMTSEINEDDISSWFDEWNRDKLSVWNEQIVNDPKYIMAVNIAVDLLDQCGNIGQAKDVANLLPDVLDIVMAGLDECIYVEIEKQLWGAAQNVQAANKASNNGFVETDMDRLISIADSYGKSAIYCTYEFAATMVPSTGWISDDMRNQKWNNGYLANYKGHQVIVLPQSYEDETNTTKVINPSYASIFPA